MHLAMAASARVGGQQNAKFLKATHAKGLFFFSNLCNEMNKIKYLLTISSKKKSFGQWRPEMAYQTDGKNEP